MTSVRCFFQTWTVWGAILALASYWLWGPFVHNDLSSSVMTVAAVVFAVSAALAFAPGIARFLSESYSVQAQQLVVGIVVLVLGIAGNRTWLWVWREAGFPDWMLHAEVNAWWLWVFLVGLALIVSSYRAIEDDVPRTAWPRLIITFSIALVLSGFVAWKRPNMEPFADWLQVYFATGPNGAICRS